MNSLDRIPRASHGEAGRRIPDGLPHAAPFTPDHQGPTARSFRWSDVDARSIGYEQGDAGGLVPDDQDAGGVTPLPGVLVRGRVAAGVPLVVAAVAVIVQRTAPCTVEGCCISPSRSRNQQPPR